MESLSQVRTPARTRTDWRDAPRLLPQSGYCEPSGVYAMPQKDFLSLESRTKVLGSLGSVWFTVPFVEEAPELVLLLDL